MREFDTGATRDTDAGKPDYEGFLSPLVLERYGEYMNKNRVQADGKVRDSDNWQKGIPMDAYMKSGWRHFFDWWLHHRGHGDPMTEEEDMEEAVCALLFNAMGYLHEHLSVGGVQHAVADAFRIKDGGERWSDGATTPGRKASEGEAFSRGLAFTPDE